MSAPLEGVRILDMTSVMMGPYATQLLGDFGADVIKIEAPEGDILRHAGAMKNPAMGYIFMHTNRNKRSVALDLKKDNALSVLKRLIARSDVLVYSLRPKAMEGLGLSYADVSAINPTIIYAGGLGFSRHGPYANRPAYDDLIQGMTGIPWLSQRASGHEPRYMPGAFADRFVGLHLALAITAAICHRQKTGCGQAVDVPMFECMASLVLGEHLGGLTFDPVNDDVGYRRTLARDRRPYRTQDGYICALIYTDRQWLNFFKAIGREDIFDGDPRFATPASRSKNVEEIYALLQSILSTRSTAEWISLLREADIPAAPVNTIQDVLTDEHLNAVGFFSQECHPTEGKMTTLGAPIEWSQTKSEVRYPPPRIGAQSVEVLRESGISDEEIESLLLERALIE
jgi:crotonobetainyl-CoA:carnitine CoA-transferase CaiB-like acyl-CoA transferase